MNDDKEMIISLFKSGCSIEGITDTIYSRLKDRENTKNQARELK